jgi:hypothetical protein
MYGRGLMGTRRPGAAAWRIFLGAAPVGEWELRFEDTPPVRNWFADGLIEDLVLLFTRSGTTPEWM